MPIPSDVDIVLKVWLHCLFFCDLFSHSCNVYSFPNYLLVPNFLSSHSYNIYSDLNYFLILKSLLISLLIPTMFILSWSTLLLNCLFRACLLIPTSLSLHSYNVYSIPYYLLVPTVIIPFWSSLFLNCLFYYYPLIPAFLTSTPYALYSIPNCLLIPTLLIQFGQSPHPCTLFHPYLLIPTLFILFLTISSRLQYLFYP